MSRQLSDFWPETVHFDLSLVKGPIDRRIDKDTSRSSATPSATRTLPGALYALAEVSAA